MVRLRLKRMGRRNRPFYRLAAMDSRSPRDSRVIEELGFYDPLARDPDQQVRLNRERIQYWLSVGAQPTDTARSLIRRAGIDIPAKPRPTKPPKEKTSQQQPAASGEASGSS